MLTHLLLCALQQDLQPQLLLDELHELPHVGVLVRETRWWDPVAGTIQIHSTLPDGTVVDAAGLVKEERRLSNLERGNVSPELLERMDQAGQRGTLHVVFWLAAYDSPDWNGMLHEAEAAGMESGAARIFTRDQAELFYRPRNEAFAERLTAAGIEVTQVLGAWPVVYARMPVAEIRDWASDEAVDQAYFCFEDVETELEHAQATMRTPIVWDSGLTAAGTPVNTMVNDPGHVSTTQPGLPPIIKIYGSGGSASHATGVAGNIAWDSGSNKGAAYGIPELYSADGTGDTGAPAAWNAAISNGVDFGNCSWWNFNKGSIVYLDRFFDHTIRNYGMMMFKSTGNQGNTSTPYTTTPGNGYCVTNSGAYSDGNSFEWSGDAMASYSSYWDPVEGHEKPELANAGDGVTTAGYSSFSGTSSASPLTCGVATLMATRDNSLRTETQAVKAILMASAWHNIEGDPVLSEKDGAGGVHALAADNVVRNGQFEAGSFTSASFGGATNSYDVQIGAPAGGQVRVCALWFSNANSSYSTDVLDMDLDMSILDPNGVSIAQSSSDKNPFEILSFTAPATGLYTVRLVKIRFDGTSEPYCIAWSYKNDSGEAEATYTGTPSLGSTITLNFKARYSPNDWYEARLSQGTIPKTVSLGSGFVLPLKSDSVYSWSAAQAGFAGTLSSSGNASTAVTIPNNPALAGNTYYLAMYTKPSSGSSTIETVSAATPITVLP